MMSEMEEGCQSSEESESDQEVVVRVRVPPQRIPSKIAGKL